MCCTMSPPSHTSMYNFVIELTASIYTPIFVCCIHNTKGVLCNSQCPDKLQLGELTSNNWHTGIKIFIALLIAGLAVVCVAIKILFACWLLRLEKKQYDYINSLDKKLECTNQPTLQVQSISDKQLPVLL